MPDTTKTFHPPIDFSINYPVHIFLQPSGIKPIPLPLTSSPNSEKPAIHPRRVLIFYHVERESDKK